GVRGVSVVDEGRAADLLGIGSHRRDGHRVDAVRRALGWDTHQARDAEGEHGVSQIMKPAKGDANFDTIDDDASPAVRLELPPLGSQVAALETGGKYVSGTPACLGDDIRLKC